MPFFGHRVGRRFEIELPVRGVIRDRAVTGSAFFLIVSGQLGVAFAFIGSGRSHEDAFTLTNFIERHVDGIAILLAVWQLERPGSGRPDLSNNQI